MCFSFSKKDQPSEFKTQQNIKAVYIRFVIFESSGAKVLFTLSPGDCSKFPLFFTSFKFQKDIYRIFGRYLSIQGRSLEWILTQMVIRTPTNPLFSIRFSLTFYPLFRWLGAVGICIGGPFDITRPAIPFLNMWYCFSLKYISKHPTRFW
jgi:hypothetical protein